MSTTSWNYLKITLFYIVLTSFPLKCLDTTAGGAEGLLRILLILFSEKIIHIKKKYENKPIV